MNNFWHSLPKPFFILAPMEAVTDVVFRHVIAKAGRPDVFFTEFTNATSYCNPKGTGSTRGRLTFTLDEWPVVAQIWGNKPEEFAQMSKDLKKMGFSGIDINMGCPDKAVVKGGAGIGLCRTPELAVELIAAAKTSGLPVSVKTRLGNTSLNEWASWLTKILESDIANLTIHLRTRKEMSKVLAHYELIPAIKALRDKIAPQTLLTINGDIQDLAHGQELVQTYGVDGIMIGRGVFSNPFAFSKTSHQPSQKELLELLDLHLELYDKYSQLESRKFEPLKRFFKIYVKGFPGASEMREQLMQTKTTEQARAVLTSWPVKTNI